jgi:hypothetical protein
MKKITFRELSRNVKICVKTFGKSDNLRGIVDIFAIILT